MNISMELTQKEATLLHNILESYLADLRMEIGGTDVFAYKEKLKDEEVVLKDLLQRLKATNFMVIA